MTTRIREVSRTVNKAKIWTAVWNTTDHGCWHVQWGHLEGQDLEFHTIKKLTDRYFAVNREIQSLRDLRFIAPCPYGKWTGAELICYNDP